MGRFGSETAMPRILELLAHFRIRAGFFIPGKVAEEYPELVKEIHRRGHEVAHHSYAHINPARQSPEETRDDFLRAHEILTRLTGVAPRGYRSPAANLTETCWQLLAELTFAYDSSLMTRELPYVLRAHNAPLVEIPFHWLLDDWVHFGFNLYPSLPYMSGISSQEKVYEIWAAEFDGIFTAGLLYVLVLHPQLIGRLSRLNMLARLLRHMRARKRVWFATPGEIAGFWQERYPEPVHNTV
jgi:peptidoglycan/xylan/chitin deacetylase (PgdA/CDA1 family)